MVAKDQSGNVSPVSNIVSIYVPSKKSIMEMNDNSISNGNRTSVSKLGGGGFVDSHNFKIYMAAAAGIGLVVLSVILVLIIFVRAKNRKSRQRRQVEYDSDDKDTYRTYEPRPPPAGKETSAAEDQQCHNATKSLSNWLDSLPRSEHSPNTTSHDLSIEQGGTLGRHSRSGNHTLTKTNPYRHKVLTNGSFLNLKDIPNGGGGNGGANAAASNSNNDNDSSRPTTSTEDNGGSSQSSESGEFHQQQLQQQLQKQLQQRLYPRDDLSVNTLPSRGNVIDTSTAKAIIDTYSGNLFSNNPHQHQRYHSFRHQDYAHTHRQPDNMSVEVGQSSLDVVDRSLSSYPHVMPAETFYDNSPVPPPTQQNTFYVRQYEDSSNSYNSSASSEA